MKSMLAYAALRCAIPLMLAFSIEASAQGGRGQKVAEAKPGDVRVMVTAAIRTPLEAVRAEAQKAVGKPLVIEYGSARGNLKDQILAGQPFEVAMLLPDVDEQRRSRERSGRAAWSLPAFRWPSASAGMLPEST
jgi:ABC-type molybdate transport system substrate-binding protein